MHGWWLERERGAGAVPVVSGREGVKVTSFVRHGEATHNVVRETHVGSDNPYLNPALTDAPLTAVGRAQAEPSNLALDDHHHQPQPTNLPTEASMNECMVMAGAPRSGRAGLGR